MALDMITSGRHVSAQEAFDTGLLDKLVAGDPVEVGQAYAQALLDAGTGPRPTRKLPCPKAADWDERLKAVMRSSRGQIAPVEAVRAVQASTELTFDAGLHVERAAFHRLMQTDQRKALIHAFFAERAVRDIPDIRDVSPRQIDSIAVVGGGTMGAGIATSALLAGLQVSLVEQSEAQVRAARDRIAANLTGAIKRGRISATAAEMLISKGLHPSTSFGALAHADVVVEAVFEDMPVKKRVFAKLDKVCKRGAVLATNTSYLDVKEIAATTSRPSDVIGLHFFSPAHVMKLLEVVVHDEASPQVVATGFALGQKLGKTAVWAGVCEGFIGNRILHASRTAADHMVLDGASPFAIDEAMLQFGYPMGPFKVSDLAGLDIGWAMRKRRAKQRDQRERVGRYADVLCEAGHFGQKTGRGFYVYSGASRKGTPNLEVDEIIRVERAARSIEPRTFHTEEIQRRYLASMVNEAAKLLEEGIARRPLDVDVVLLAGYAFPRHHGGPCKWADLKGLKHVLDDVREFAREDDYFWQPAPLLEKLVAEDRCFDDLNKA
jgi:3-hydroxyacyl-CoA dehydrogenase